MGLVKRQNKNGSTTWFIRYWHQGVEHWEAAGPHKRLAERALAKRKTQITEGTFFPRPEGNHWRYARLLERYLAYGRVTKKPRTAALDRRVAWLLHSTFGQLPLTAMTPGKIRQFLLDHLRSGKAPSTVNYYLALLKHSFTMAVQWELLPDNPLRSVRLPVPILNHRTRYLTVDEYHRLLAACSPLWRHLVLVAVHTGMRKAEILGLEWAQVHPQEGYLELAVGSTKNRRTRAVFLNETVLRVFAERRAAQVVVTPYIWCNPRTMRPYRYDYDTGWYEALAKAGLTDVHFHDLRHTTGAHLRLNGVDLLTIKDILGHRDLAMTQRYAHISPAKQLEAVQSLTNTLDRSKGT